MSSLEFGGSAHSPPAEGVPSLASALVEGRTRLESTIAITGDSENGCGCDTVEFISRWRESRATPKSTRS
jgi:hypothetical protein